MKDWLRHIRRRCERYLNNLYREAERGVYLNMFLVSRFNVCNLPGKWQNGRMRYLKINNEDE